MTEVAIALDPAGPMSPSEALGRIFARVHPVEAARVAALCDRTGAIHVRVEELPLFDEQHLVWVTGL